MCEQILITYIDGHTEVRDASEYSGTSVRPSLYPLETLQKVFGDEDGTDFYTAINKRYDVKCVDYIIE